MAEPLKSENETAGTTESGATLYDAQSARDQDEKKTGNDPVTRAREATLQDGPRQEHDTTSFNE